MEPLSDLQWGREEFAHAELGDERRTQRLVVLAQTALTRSQGCITGTFEEPAQREAAFRWVENRAISVAEVTRASATAAARRAADLSFAFVPVDGTALTIVDRGSGKGLGSVGARSKSGRGVQAMTAMVVSPTGTPLGIGHQVFWARRGRKRPRGRLGGRKDRRQLRSRETHHWVDALASVTATFHKHAPSTQPWFQLDRGADSWEVLRFAHELGALVTVRASANRRLWGDRRLWGEKDPGRRYLRERMGRQPVAGYKQVDVSAGANRRARRAAKDVAACRSGRCTCAKWGRRREASRRSIGCC